MSRDDFSLAWNDHHSFFFETLEKLCRNDLLTDVTLTCGNRYFSAHKLVLSVCSGYFSSLFNHKLPGMKSNESHSIVYMKDVPANHMELLLEYMYKGAITCPESELQGNSVYKFYNFNSVSHVCSKIQSFSK